MNIFYFLYCTIVPFHHDVLLTLYDIMWHRQTPPLPPPPPHIPPSIQLTVLDKRKCLQKNAKGNNPDNYYILFNAVPIRVNIRNTAIIRRNVIDKKSVFSLETKLRNGPPLISFISHIDTNSNCSNIMKSFTILVIFVN